MINPPLITIGDLIPEVQQLLGNRTDLEASIPLWIRDSLLEITEDYEFDELRVTGPQYNITTAAGPNYNINNFMNPGDRNTAQIPVFMMYYNYPVNNILIPLSYAVPSVVETITPYKGPPTLWTRFGSNITFGFTPDKTYTVYMKYQREHPINDQNLTATEVMILRSWIEVVKISAAMRGSIALRMPDYTKLYDETLFGDTKYISSKGRQGRPGLVARLTTQPERDQRWNSQSMNMRSPAYNWGTGY